MNKLMKIFRNLLKPKCPKCNGKMTQDFIHHFWGGNSVNGYTCNQCKKQWI